jgi:hypothetical protein
MKKFTLFKSLIWVSLALTLLFIPNKNLYPQFQQEWVKRVNGTQNGPDYGVKIAIDKENNIYVASGISNSSYDYALIKYNSSGMQLWISTYDGTANGTDAIRDLVLDNLGNAYVTGESIGIGTAIDCVTIKYDSSGNRVWVKRYDFGVGKNDYGKVIKYFNNNIYVFGLSTNSNDKYAYLLIKYDTSGNQQWLKRYSDIDDNGADMVLDRFGNIYVTGTSFTMGIGTDIGIIKYSPDGNTIWSRRLDYNSGNTDCSNSMAIDSNDNIIITGYTLDKNTYNESILTVKYDSSGTLNWNKIYRSNLIDNTDEGTQVGIDKNNNIYVIGYTTIGLNNRDYITIRYKSNGDTSWIRTYNGPGNNMDYPKSLVIDNQSKAYISGQSYGIGSSFDYFTIVYDTTGNVFWSNRFNGTDNAYDATESIKLDDFGNIYLTGASGTVGTQLDITTIKFSQTNSIQRNYQILPLKYSLFQNYPNPFNPYTNIKFSIFENGKRKIENVILKVCDVTGKEVAILVNEKLSMGTYEVKFDANNFSSGIYFYALIVEGIIIDTKKMIILK